MLHEFMRQAHRKGTFLKDVFVLHTCHLKASVELLPETVLSPECVDSRVCLRRPCHTESPGWRV